LLEKIDNIITIKEKKFVKAESFDAGHES